MILGGHGYVCINSEKLITKYFEIDSYTDAFRELLIIKKLAKLNINVPAYRKFNVELSTHQIKNIIDEDFYVSKTLSITMENCGKELYKYEFSDERELIQVFSDYFGTLKCIHSNGIAHTDLKHNNLMVHQNRGIVIDFSTACNNNTKSNYSKCFAYSVMAPPELRDKEEILTEYNITKLDAWQMGFVLFNTIVEDGIKKIEPDYKKICLSYKFKKIISKFLDEVKNYKYIKTYKKIILGLLEQDMDMRMTMAQAYNELGILCNRTGIFRNEIDYSIIPKNIINKCNFIEADKIITRFCLLYMKNGINRMNIDGIESRISLIYNKNIVKRSIDTICHAVVILLAQYMYLYDFQSDDLCRDLQREYEKIFIFDEEISSLLVEHKSMDDMHTEILRAMAEICAFHEDLFEYNHYIDN